MFTEQTKDVVYFSDLFKRDYPNVFTTIQLILEAHHVACRTLPCTRDYWCRDYMPVQYDRTHYTQFAYTPDYLKAKPSYQTDPALVLQSGDILSGMHLYRSPLVADGGNFTICETKQKGRSERASMVVLTEKIFAENPTYSREEVMAELQRCFPGQEWLFLPWEGPTLDPFGHTDGLLHNLGQGRVLVNLEVYSPDVADEIYRRLSEHFEVVELLLSHYDPASWAYMNMLQTREVIIVPGLGLPTDQEALAQIQSLHPEYAGRVYQVDLSSIIRRWSGALNCLTWTTSTAGSQMQD